MNGPELSTLAQSAADGAEPRPVRRITAVWARFSANRGAIVGCCVAVLLTLVALFADVIAPHNPYQQYRDAILVPPSWTALGASSYLLGTDDIGRDIFSRLVHGSRASLLIGLSVVVLSLAIGVPLGMAAGFFRGRVDALIMGAVNMLLSMPSLLLAIVCVAILGPGLFNASLAIAIASCPHYVRLMRSSAMVEAGKDYVTASRLVGASRLRIMCSAILPNCVAPMIVQATLGFSSAVLDAAALGFLGLGAQPPSPEWGSMLANSLQFIHKAWWLTFFPGLAILITVLAFNLSGDGLRDALDPKMRL